ncbi:uncharacterized protein LOC143838891 [Paroedura picta]|uniref:uncharacterized protein LOC143838891 n=1 Tax=Paroedura picta TaxID=143630 RepID=UPI00405603E8
MLPNYIILVTVGLHWFITYKRSADNVAIVDASIIPVGDPNIAVGKISSQSSTFETEGESRKAVDGSLANSYANGECTLTKKEFEPWWMVDLVSAFQVSAVVVTNRGDCCETRIKGAEILIGDLPEKGGTMNPRCATISSMDLGETMTFNCAGMQGQYVTITIPGRREFLSLCEVQVLGHPWLHIVHDGGRNPVRDSETDLGLQGRALSFLNESKPSFVVISPLQPLNLMEFTLCMKVSAEYLGERKVILFSYHSPNDELRILRESSGHFGMHMGGRSVMFALPDLSAFGSHLCVTWESTFGLATFWINGKRSIRKIYNVGHVLQPGGTAVLGQDQSVQTASEKQNRRFVGEIADLYMWDYVLQPQDIENVFQMHDFPSGNIFDWKILSYKIKGNVRVLPERENGAYEMMPGDSDGLDLHAFHKSCKSCKRDMAHLKRTFTAMRWCFPLLLLAILPELLAERAVNVAIQGNALQSSTFSPLGIASNAIDGIIRGEFSDGSCAHTDEETNPWWIVDLKSEYQVIRVSISNRVDCCAYRLDGAEIRIGNSPEAGGTLNPRCAVIESLGLGETQSFYCENRQGRYVTVNQPNGGILTLCEVQVFGQKITSATESRPEQIQPSRPLAHGEQDETSDTGPNVALEGKAFQISTYNSLGEPENAVDGASSANYMHGHCTHTDLEINPWWTVDLGAVFQVRKVSVLNRGDCCADRINGAEIRIGNSPEKGGITNPRCATINSLSTGETGIFDCGEAQGQYVTVTIPGIQYLTLCEVQVFGVKLNTSELSSGIEQYVKPRKPFRRPGAVTKGRSLYSVVYNAALDGKALQSSIYNHLGGPENALEDFGSSNYLRGHCTHTQQEDNPWWMVDLRARFKVSSLHVTNRGDCCEERLEGAEIRIGNSKDQGGTSNPRCATITMMGAGETRKFDCGEMIGQYVTLTIPGKKKYLSVCEVQVFGVRVPPLIPNVALGGTASQSSTLNKLGVAENAIDGSTSVNFMRRSCTHTDLELNPWWTVDLKAEFSVSSVSLTNREDCCASRLNGAEIRIGNSLEEGGTRNPRCAIVTSVGAGETQNYKCEGMHGQYVTITIPGFHYLTLCEVEVFGMKVESSGEMA